MIQGIQKPLPSLDLVPTAWVHWWVGNSVGQLMVAPLLLAWSVPAREPRARRYGDLLLAAVGVALVVLLTLGRVPMHPLMMLAIIYPGLVWIGLRRGIRGVTTANVLIAPAIIWAGALGTGFLWPLPVAERLAYVSFFLATGSLFSMMLCAMFEERRAMIERLADLASKDSLVPLSNRRHFIELSERETAKALRHGRPLTLVLLDIDHFKRVNDLHGHAVGDQAIRLVADGCLRVLRRGDVSGRIGGEEFALALPETDLDGGQQLAERLRELVAATPLQLDGGGELRLTVSLGLAPLQTTLAAAMSAADRAMYRAKESDRNRTCRSGNHGDA